MARKLTISGRQFMATTTAAAAANIFLVGRSSAQAWPDRPMTLVVNSDIGGSADRLARGLAQFLTPRLNTPVGVVNKPDAGGALGYQYLPGQPDDGYTLFAGTFAPVMSIAGASGVGKYNLFINAN